MSIINVAEVGFRRLYKYGCFWEISLEDSQKTREERCRLKMTGVYKNLILLALLAAVRASPLVGPEPIRCAPCTQEKLDACPAVSAECQQVLREPGCGCCMACALQKGAYCGVHTAHCAEGLRCSPRPGEARPLFALTRGQGICTEDVGQGCANFPS